MSKNKLWSNQTFRKAYLKKEISSFSNFSSSYVSDWINSSFTTSLVWSCNMLSERSYSVGWIMHSKNSWICDFISSSNQRLFFLMSLAPTILGFIPLFVFIFLPITMKPVLTICMVSSFIGLISPSPDYVNVLNVLKVSEECSNSWFTRWLVWLCWIKSGTKIKASFN